MPNMNPNGMDLQKLAAQGMEQLRLEFHAGLAADTNLLIDDRLRPISNLIFQLRTAVHPEDYANGWPTYGIYKDKVVDANITPFPADILSKDVAEIKFSTGYVLRCLPVSMINTDKGWQKASTIVDQLKPSFAGERYKIKAYITNPDIGTQELDDVIAIDGTVTHSTISEKMYFTKTNCGNILLPHLSLRDNNITFIEVMQ